VRLAALAAAALVLAAPATACTKHASQASLETKLVCPACHTTLDESDSDVAREMKSEVAGRVAACQTEKQILAAMVDEFGPTVLSTPRTHGFDLLAWILPLGGAAIGAAALAVGARRWSHSRAEPAAGAPSPLGPEDERRVDDALARFDG
jgi:cytochrome c-type biogenesis protein CcmH/NrfF